jgi:hypothetical protein
VKLSVEGRTMISAGLCVVFAGLLFASYAFRLGEGATGAFGAALTLCLASTIDGAAAMRTLRRESNSMRPPPAQSDYVPVREREPEPDSDTGSERER